MSAQGVPSGARPRTRQGVEQLRMAFLGPEVWIESICPPAAATALRCTRIRVDPASEWQSLLAAAADFQPHVTVILDPVSMPAQALSELPGVTLGILVGGAPIGEPANAIAALDRVVSFRPALTGAQIAGGTIWRAIPPPVSDALFGRVRPLHGTPRAMAVGRSTAHRERMLLPAKHHHDLLHVIHGVLGEELVELFGEYDVAVYVPPEPGGGFGHQVGMHLAAGQLLLAENLLPAHGLERNIDYLHFDSAGELVRVLERLGRFPEMHQRIRVRGRLKAEQYRASRMFRRVGHDLLADVAAFGSPRPGS
jgi:hypothetical protein